MLASISGGFDFGHALFTAVRAARAGSLMLSKPAKPGAYTKDALRTKKEAKIAHEEQLAIAVALAARGGGAGQKLSSKVEGCSRQQIDRAIAKAALVSPPRQAWAILTATETKSLVKWILACAQNDNPAVEA